MKKINLFILMLLISAYSFSQVTISAADNCFIVNDNVDYISIFGADAFDPGADGENVIWDFSALVPDGDHNIFDYLDPTGKPHVDIMTDADVAEQLNSGSNGYFYFDNNGGTQWNRSGFYANDGGIEIWLAYDGGPLQLYPDNFTYQTSHDVVPFGATGGWYMDGVGEDEAIIPNLGEYHFDCDAYGTLILPHKVYLNAMRVHVTEDFQIQLMMNGSPAVTSTVSDDAYYWFVEGVQGPVLSYVVSNSAKSTTHTLQWQKPYDAIEVDFIAVNNTSGASSTTGNTDDEFKMLNLSYPLDNGSSFTWEFTPNNVQYLEGTDANSAHPIVRFTQPGTYTVTQTITNANFTPDTQTETKTDYITIELAPQLMADFSASPTSVNLNGSTDFTSNVSVSNGDPISGTTTYQWAVSPGAAGVHWNFTNFTTNTDQNPSVEFYQAGCYAIQLVVTNSTYSNSPVTVTKMNYINVAGGCGTSYDVTFNVVDENTDPISGAQITVDGYSAITTNASGEATINLFDDTYNFDVAAAGYEDYSSSFTVNGTNQTVNVTLVEVIPTEYTVTFTVVDENTNPVLGADITVDGYSAITTDASGVATIDLVDGTYNFDVAAAGFENYSSDFTVNAANEDVDISLSPLSIDDLTNANISIYPNPSNGIFTIQSVNIVNITIFDVNGKIIYKNSNITQANVDLSKNQKGIYFIEFKNNNISINHKIIIK
ncbi:MAG: carboxypeptidase regulatory-like domain-containing protein [Bacteroidales bacterium]|nr:carboxypeptidase regulatory-like domain-containing protein [Bacteroidales bacterium]